MNIIQLCGVAPLYGGDVTWAYEVSMRLIKRGHMVIQAPLYVGEISRHGSIHEITYKIKNIDNIKSLQSIVNLARLFIHLLFNPDRFVIHSIILAVRAESTIHSSIAQIIRISYLYELALENDVDVLIAHHANQRGLAALIVARLTRSCAVIFVHGGAIFNDASSNGQKRVTKWVLKHSSLLLFCSRNSWKRAKKLGMDESKAKYIKLGVEMIHLDKSRLDENIFTIGFHGGITRERGLDKLILALPNLNIERPIRLVISGRDVDGIWADLKNLFSKVNINNEVQYLGQVDHEEYLDLLMNIDIMALVQEPGKTGSLVTCLEAQAVGVPVLTTGNAGLDEYVNNGVTGIVCGTGVDNIRNGIETIYERCRLRGWASEEFNSWVEFHSWDKVAIEVEAALNRVLLVSRNDK